LITNFYVKKLGFRKISQGKIPKEIMRQIFGLDHDCRMSKFSYGDVLLEIFWCPSLKFPRRLSTLGYNHFGLQVDNKQAFCGKLERRFKLKIIKVSRLAHYTYFIQDPDGNLIEIMEPAR
jgi:catechol 2,3-dioxygenase-like lactoylglutathione lyase family enzyme